MTSPAGTVAVLLCTYNGSAYLAEQLNSIVAPEGWACRIYASDDGSADDTVELLQAFAASDLSLELREGPRSGPAANFLSLLCDATVGGELFAYCDQDDIWSRDKLSRAVAALQSIDTQTPALYCGRTRTVDEDGQAVGLSPAFLKTPSFANALVHNIAGGNTMVMNAAARELLRAAGTVEVPAHDWWTYLLVSGAGGRVVYDAQPVLDYRQHRENQVGANRGVVAVCTRYLKALAGQNRQWNALNIAALEHNRELLSAQNAALLERFKSLRSGSLLHRLGTLKQAGLYAQSRRGNLGLFLATLLKKL